MRHFSSIILSALVRGQHALTTNQGTTATDRPELLRDSATPLDNILWKIDDAADLRAMSEAEAVVRRHL